jgi:hypothetical protein
VLAVAVRRASESGQATVELVAVLPVVALIGVTLWQLAVAGHAAWLAGSAARAAARAHAVGDRAADGARAVLPPRLERGVKVRTGQDGEVTVTVPVPSVVGPGRLTTVDGRARFEPQTP